MSKHPIFRLAHNAHFLKKFSVISGGVQAWTCCSLTVLKVRKSHGCAGVSRIEMLKYHVAISAGKTKHFIWPKDTEAFIQVELISWMFFVLLPRLETETKLCLLCPVSSLACYVHRPVGHTVVCSLTDRVTAGHHCKKETCSWLCTVKPIDERYYLFICGLSTLNMRCCGANTPFQWNIHWVPLYFYLLPGIDSLINVCYGDTGHFVS